MDDEVEVDGLLPVNVGIADGQLPAVPPGEAQGRWGGREQEMAKEERRRKKYAYLNTSTSLSYLGERNWVVTT